MRGHRALADAISSAAAPSEIWLASAAVMRPPVGAAARSAAIFSSDVSRRGPSSARDAAVRRDLPLEPALVDGADGAPVALQRELLHVVAADAPLLGDHLGAAELGHLLIAVARRASRRSRRTDRVKPSGSAAVIAAGDRDLAHVLHAAGDDHVRRAAHHRLRREVHGLLRRAALPVDGHAGHLLGQPGRQPGGAGDVARLRADGVDAAEDHVVDGGGIDPGALDQRADHVRAEVGRMGAGEPAAAPADRRTDRVDDVRFRPAVTCHHASLGLR